MLLTSLYEATFYKHQQMKHFDLNLVSQFCIDRTHPSSLFITCGARGKGDEVRKCFECTSRVPPDVRVSQIQTAEGLIEHKGSYAQAKRGERGSSTIKGENKAYRSWSITEVALAVSRTNNNLILY